MEAPRFYIIMGVSGCGKTVVGQALASRLGWDFYDADSFHPPENIAKMSSGTPLNDADRAPWLDALHRLILSCLEADRPGAPIRPGVLACSALKERYRQALIADISGVQMIYLRGSYEVIWARMNARADHYMKPEMLQSQMNALEEPQNALALDITPPVEEIVEQIIRMTR